MNPEPDNSMHIQGSQIHQMCVWDLPRWFFSAFFWKARMLICAIEAAPVFQQCFGSECTVLHGTRSDADYYWYLVTPSWKISDNIQSRVTVEETWFSNDNLKLWYWLPNFWLFLEISFYPLRCNFPPASNGFHDNPLVNKSMSVRICIFDKIKACLIHHSMCLSSYGLSTGCNQFKAYR